MVKHFRAIGPCAVSLQCFTPEARADVIHVEEHVKDTVCVDVSLALEQ